MRKSEIPDYHKWEWIYVQKDGLHESEDFWVRVPARGASNPDVCGHSRYQNRVNRVTAVVIWLLFAGWLSTVSDLSYLKSVSFMCLVAAGTIVLGYFAACLLHMLAWCVLGTWEWLNGD